jgi:hypothetical protein
MSSRSLQAVLAIIAALTSPGIRAAGLPDTVEIRSVLIIRSAPGFPDNIARRDPIESAFVNGTWRTPKEGERVRYNDTASGTWERIRAGAAGWYDHPALDGAYLFADVESDEDAPVFLEAFGNSMVYVNGECRSGNPYGAKDAYESWETRFDYSMLPARLHPGHNELLFHCTRGVFKARLVRAPRPYAINARDATLPDIITGTPYTGKGSVVIINATSAPGRGLTLTSAFPGEAPASTPVPLLQPFSVRKVAFAIRAGAARHTGTVPLLLSLTGGRAGGPGDTAHLIMRVVGPADPRKETFVSGIDSSVQYYAVTPSSGHGETNALFLSLHGAGVEAINQAASYTAKTWGHIVAPTNRRPYGFNWEDWGRDDALEVLALAKSRYRIDESRVYLTGHSMGGHGVYHVGSLFPDQFAALGPSAGWISFWTYRVRETVEHPSPVRQMLMRATLPSETYTMGENFTHFGMYILHGSEDDNVLVGESRAMARYLSAFDHDFIYHEQQGVGHWWDISDAPGADCVDWPPMFDYFARHARPLAGMVRDVEFVTPAPNISAHDCWVTVDAQQEQFRLSRVSLRFEPGVNRVKGTTMNIARMAIDPGQMGASGPLSIEIDSGKIAAVTPYLPDTLVWLYRTGSLWHQGSAPAPLDKGRNRYGSFKNLFRNDVLFVFGTGGSAEEQAWAFNKARFDAERFWYQGNGSIEVVSDAEFSADRGTDRNIVLYGNAGTNSAWKELLGAGPVEAKEGEVVLGERSYTGNDLGYVFIRPRRGSTIACVGAIGGTGIQGMRLTDRMPYLLPGVAFPDVIIARSSLLLDGESGVAATGFFGIDWSVNGGEFVFGTP